MKIIPLKMDDTKKSNLLIHLYKRNPFKNEGHKKPLKFYIRNPFKISDRKKFLGKSLEK